MVRIVETIIVEGTYDKIKLSQLVDTTIITTGGFSIFKDPKKLELIRKLANKTGIIIFTDSDRAGFLIRNYIKKSIPINHIKHAYIPEIKGKEKRKRIPGKEGILGVEGISNSLIIEALKKSGCTIIGEIEHGANLIQGASLFGAEHKSPQFELIQNIKITKTDLFLDGLTGRTDSHEMRRKLCKFLGLPSRISANALLEVLNKLYSHDKYKHMLKEILK